MYSARRRPWWAFLLLMLFAPAPSASAQAPLMLVDDDTQVSRISFRFVDTRTFDEQRLRDQIALTERTFFDGLRDRLPLMSGRRHPFDPVALQKDVVRLRQYYNRHGFLHPDIDYPASQLDTSDNQIHVIFRIEEGPPVIIQDVTFLAPDERFAYYQFGERLQAPWIDFRQRITVHTGDRYTDFDRLRIQDEAQGWLRDRGHAFARVSSEVAIDTMANTADLGFHVDPGPLTYIDSIIVEGNESVSRRVVLRELPFKEGDLFRHRRLVSGQRSLFGLNLFRLALVEVPEQPRDSTVTVRVRVREGFPRYVNAQTGYGSESGASVEGRWAHRNFFGGAREFSASLVANSGYLATLRDDRSPTRLFRASLWLRQPYLFVRRLSASVSPFLQYEADPLLRTEAQRLGRQPLGINVREIGLNSTLVYQLLQFRTLSLQHTFSRARFFETILSPEGQLQDRFNRSILSVNALLGKTDDYVRPTRGYLLKPFAEVGGRFLASDINYLKLGTEATYYRPLTTRTRFDARVFVGQIQLLQGSRYRELELFNAAGRIKVEAREFALLENRFDRIRFYAGGGSDVRGWNFRELGPQVVRADSIFIDDDGELRAARARFEALGGLGKFAANLELGLPFPGLGRPWSSAIFLDMGQIYEGSPTLRDLRYGIGAGLRYETLVGYIRFDVGFKVNPSLTDLNTPEDIYLYRNGLKYESRDDLPNPFIRRFAIHLSIGQAF